ncbi:hypothetical protein CPB85DRAFT_1024537 [Mucidula mucida]|nr:hypothetical protein CPB85DRAFT_1024537 [Mucidula mucida]
MAIDAVRRFTELRRQHPELSETQLLNSNNPRGFTGSADVVVAGAGILGLCYAIHLKNISPDLKIDIFEKSLTPIQKIGESTLSPFATFTTGDVLPYDYLLRIFALKDGLHFYSVDQEGRDVTAQDIGGLDIAFQLDRRMSELFMTMWAQSLGINVYHGVAVDFEVPAGGSITTDLKLDELSISKPDIPVRPFSAPKVLLKDSSNTIGTSIDARLVCDASGFSRRLTGKFAPREKFESSWNADAYYTYFREKDTSKIEDRLLCWDYPATKHLCFPEGWGWFIGLISWERAPLANLMDLCAQIITSAAAGVPADKIPCTRALSKTFDCPFEFISSIGWAVRNDFQLPSDLSAYGTGEGEQKFNFFKKRYPTIDKLLTESYELLPNYYGKTTYFVKKGLAYRSPVVAGEGWLAIGNSAGFTNPLISPGINAGVAGSWSAANLTAQVLAAPAQEAKAAMLSAAKEHQKFMYDFALPRLFNMNRLWHNAFRDHRLFESIPKTLWAASFEEVDDHYFGVQRQQLYAQADANWMLGSGLDAFQDLCAEVLPILDGPNGGAPPSEEDIAKVLAITGRVVEERTGRWPQNSWGNWLRQYDNKLQKIPGKRTRNTGFLVEATRCFSCRYFVHNRSTMCPICGEKDSWSKSMAMRA